MAAMKIVVSSQIIASIGTRI